MIGVYIKNDKGIEKHSSLESITSLDDVLWVDLLNMEPEESKKMSDLIGMDLPSYEEMYDIELSSRLHQRKGSPVMTVIIASKSNSKGVTAPHCTFLMYKTCMITVRYAEIAVFDELDRLILEDGSYFANGQVAFVEIMKSISDSLADLLECTGRVINSLSREIFWQIKDSVQGRMAQHDIMENVGRNGDVISKVRESLLTIVRACSYALKTFIASGALKGELEVLIQDLGELTSHGAFLSSQVKFLLDATLGMINIEQNNIIKLFSIASLVFMPSTLVASIYGMNFAHMSLLQESWGYPYALSLMLISSMAPYIYAKKRRWL